MRRVFPLGLLVALISPCWASSIRHEAEGADEVRYTLTKTADFLEVRATGAGVDRPDQALFVALGTDKGQGSSLVPASPGVDGEAVWLPFPAEVLVTARMKADGAQGSMRRWNEWDWASPADGGLSVAAEPAEVSVRIPAKLLPDGSDLRVAAYLKDLAADEGKGRLYGAIDRSDRSGTGVRTLRHFVELAAGEGGTAFRRTGRTDPGAPKMRIYQLLPRLFGNTNETRKPNGTLAENGSGKFSALNDASLAELQGMGFTHIWLTGVPQQATATDYSDIGEPADDPDLLKGLAGSPYAIRDYFDVSPDYADDPAKRIDEFEAVIARIHAKGMKVLIDFVPNHVARSHDSTVKPELSFGAKDDRTKFFAPDNNFFYLTPDSGAESSAPLRLPTVDGNGRPTSPTVQASSVPGDGLFEPEREVGRVTGNNIISWAPGADTWYETVKLNYGYNFKDPDNDGRRYPRTGHADIPVPDTWKKMNDVIAYWQGLGVDGFRADMAHMVPPEFWRWLIARARERQPDVFFVAEAYDTDPAKVPGSDPGMSAVTGGHVMLDLLGAGFDAVYDDPTYDAVKAIYDGGGSANDIDRQMRAPFFFDNALQYAENHDEVRLAAAGHWGGHGARVGRAVAPLLYGLSRGPVMLYHGQEVGEPAAGSEGFGGDDGRTSIFDYWSMPEFAKWVNDGKFDGGRLSAEQRNLRDFYRRLLTIIDQPAFRDGDFLPLNPENLDNPDYGRVGGADSGRWVYSYLRSDPATGQRVLVVVNLHPDKAMRDLRVRLPDRAMRFLGWDNLAGSRTVPVRATDRLGDVPSGSAEITATPADLRDTGLTIKELPPLTAAYYELQAPRMPSAR